MIDLATALSYPGMGAEASQLALDLILHQIVEQACLATGATGAAIALEREGEILCRASAGENAPGLGVRLNTQVGLSGICVQTRQPQICEDTEADPRVNGEACRELGVRSILVAPVLREERVAGVVEVFSLLPYAFGDRDILTVQALARRVVEAMYGIAKAHQARVQAEEARAAEAPAEAPTLEAELEEGPVAGSAPAEPEPLPRVAEEPSREETAAPLEPPACLAEPDPAVSPALPVSAARDYVAGGLTVAAIAVALLLGWLLGYARWNRHAPERGALPAPAAPSGQNSGPTAASSEIVFPSSPTVPSAALPAPKGVSPGGLVVYEDGKVIFQLAPRTSSPPADKPTLPATIAPEVASSRVVYRVEPEYPAEARQKHVQGAVVLNALVGADGVVQELKVVSGEALLAPAAADAVKQWRFKPYRRNGAPSEFETNITVNFLLP